MANRDSPLDGSEWRDRLSRNGRQKEVRRRQRQTLSCLPCRRLKVKCDRERPCGHCVWSERIASCRYSSFPRDPKSPANGSSGVDQVDALISIHSSTVQTRPKFLLLPKTQVLQNGDTEGLSSSISDSASPDRKEEHVNHNLSSSYNAHDAWKSKFRGTTHWSTVLRELENNLPRLSGTDAVEEPVIKHLFDTTTNCFHSATMSPNYPFGSGYQSHSPSKEEILTYIHDLPTVASLIENYVETIERTHPLLHVPTFRNELAQFWANPAAVDDGWLAQLLVMLALGYQSSTGETEEEVVQRLLVGGEACLKATPFLFAPTFTALRTLCMMMLAKRTTATTCLEVDSCGPLMSTVVRLAMSIGLHCDPQDDVEISPFEKEIRRRLWTTIAYMEIQMAMSTGVPLLLRFSDFDTRPPANINDADLSPSIPQCVSIRPSMEYTDATFQIILARSFDIAFDVVSRANSVADVFEYNQVLRYSAGIKQLLHEASQVYDWTPSAAKEEWKHLQKFSLGIFLRRVLLVLHSYYGRIPDAYVLYPVSYWSSLECSLALLVIQRQMSEDLSSPKTRVWLAEFLKHEFYLAALIVCLQVARNDALGVDEMGSMPHHEIEILPKQTILQTLRCCRDIWARKICRSLCHFLTHMTIGTLITKLESPEKFLINLERTRSLRDSVKVLKDCKCGKCDYGPGSTKYFFLHLAETDL